MAADPRGKYWKQAQAFAKQGSYGRAKHNVEKGGGTWSLDMSRSLRKTGDYTSWNKPKTPAKPEVNPETAALQSSVDSLIEQLGSQQQEQANALAQQQSSFQAQQKAQQDRLDRLKPRDVSQAWRSTLLSGGRWWKDRERRNTFLKPFASMLRPGGN